MMNKCSACFSVFGLINIADSASRLLFLILHHNDAVLGYPDSVIVREFLACFGTPRYAPPPYTFLMLSRTHSRPRRITHALGHRNTSVLEVAITFDVLQFFWNNKNKGILVVSSGPEINLHFPFTYRLAVLSRDQHSFPLLAV